MITGYYTPHPATTSNTKRTGTYRVGSDQSTPILITHGWDTTLYFAFRDYNQKTTSVLGKNFKAKLYNVDGTQVWEGDLVDNPSISGSATLKINSTITTSLGAGLYKLLIQYTENEQTQVVSTANNLGRWVVEVIDF